MTCRKSIAALAPLLIPASANSPTAAATAISSLVTSVLLGSYSPRKRRNDNDGAPSREPIAVDSDERLKRITIGPNLSQPTKSAPAEVGRFSSAAADNGRG